MKTLIITTLLMLSINLVANELKWVDEQIEAIKPPRSGISKEKINTVQSPFIFLSNKKDKSKATSSSKKRAYKASASSGTRKNKIYKRSKKLVLSAIINQSALINKKWYKLNDKVGKYTLSSISRTSVILSYKKKELLLSTNTKNSNLKFKNK